MKIFILEDDPNRIDWFKENLMTDDLDITQDVAEAMKWLKSKEYDAVFLDHDLGGEVFVDSAEWNTGATVAQMIHETPNKVLDVVIHSWNPCGAKIMRDSMRANGVSCFYFPFQNMDFLRIVKQMNDFIISKSSDGGKDEKKADDKGTREDSET